MDEQQPRAVLLFSGTRGWLRFVVLVTDSRPTSQRARSTRTLGREKEGYVD